MRFLATLFAAIFISSCASTRTNEIANPHEASPASFAKTLDQFVGKGRLTAAVGHSYATGCYHAYQALCQRVGQPPSEIATSECYEEGLKTCEKDGEAFQNWILDQKAKSKPKREVKTLD